MYHEDITDLSIPFDIHAYPLNNQHLAEQFKTRFPKLKTLCLSNSSQLTWEEAQDAYIEFERKEVEISFSDCPRIYKQLLTKIHNKTLTNEDIDTPWLRHILFKEIEYGGTALAWALNGLSYEGPDGLEIINIILSKFKDLEKNFLR